MTIIDSQILLEAKNLMKDKFDLMISYFVEDTENYIADVDSGFVECDYRRISLAAHTIKSSSQQLGALSLSELGKDIEEMANNENRAGIEKNLSNLKKIFRQTKEALAAA